MYLSHYIDTWYCSPECQAGHDDRDGVEAVSKAIMYEGLKFLTRKDGVREGDGPYVMDTWRMCLPQFWDNGHPKYLINAHYMLAGKYLQMFMVPLCFKILVKATHLINVIVLPRAFFSCIDIMNGVSSCKIKESYFISIYLYIIFQPSVVMKQRELPWTWCGTVSVIRKVVPAAISDLILWMNT